MDKPEALQLADAIDPLTRRNLDNLTCAAAAAELRRLSAVEAQRDELLEALRALVLNEGLDAYVYLDKGIGTETAAGQRWLNARAAIKSVEGEKNHG